MDSVVVEDQQTLAQPAAPTKVSDDPTISYVFDGWYTAGDFSAAYDFDTPVTKDLTLYAKWREIIAYTITFNPNGGNVNPTSSTTNAEGKLASLPTPARPGYRFISWYDAPNGGRRVTTDTVFTGNAEFFAQWTAASSGGSSSGGGIYSSGYSVTIATPTHGKVTANPTSGNAGSKITLTVTPEPGYVLDTLTAKDSHGNEVQFTKNSDGTYSFTMPAANVTVNAAFKNDAETPIPTAQPSEPDPAEAQTCKHDADCPLTAFTDLDPDAWYHDGVHWALENGVMNGMGDGLFQPDTSTSRAMIVTILWRMEGAPEYPDLLDFTDVEPDSWYASAVRWTASEEIVNGYNETTFGPNDSVTREQLVTILCRYANYRGEDVDKDASLSVYTDSAKISDWAESSLRWAIASGIIHGIEDNVLSPDTEATRAQVATMLMRYSK